MSKVREGEGREGKGREMLLYLYSYLGQVKRSEIASV